MNNTAAPRLSIYSPDAVADALDAAERQGERTDEPEGARYVVLSDTLARRIADGLREWSTHQRRKARLAGAGDAGTGNAVEPDA